MAQEEKFESHLPRPGEEQYPQDFPIAVHTLSNGDQYVDLYPMQSFLREDFALPHPEATLRWIHFPVNHMGWVEECVAKLCADFPGLAEDSWKHMLRPVLPETLKKPLHSRHMEPSCSAGKSDAGKARLTVPLRDLPFDMQLRMPVLGDAGAEEAKGAQLPLIAVYIPYINWETYGNYCNLRAAYEGRSATFGVDIVPSPEQENRLDMEEAQAQSEHLNGESPLHLRRTLDQFYYSSLSDTKQRDADQTISKWTGSNLTEEGRDVAAMDSRMIMVDQLWCWVLDSKTVFTVFPCDNLQYDGCGFTPLYGILRRTWSKHSTVWDLYASVVKEAATHLFRQDNKKFTDLVETYRWVIGKKFARQTTFFEEFHRVHSTTGSRAELFEDIRELKTVLEVADIIDELKMFHHLVDKQREVLKSLILALIKFHPSVQQDNSGVQATSQISENQCRDNAVQINSIQIHTANPNLADTIKILAQGVEGPARDIVTDFDDILTSFLAELESMRNDAEYTHKMLLDLLDLKQKTAALEEARSTSQQGKVVMLFTIVTIIFLPLSFFTSYFGQNISEITGDDKNPTAGEVWRYGAPISAVIILLALLVAYYIHKSGQGNLFWRKKRPQTGSGSQAV